MQPKFYPRDEQQEVIVLRNGPKRHVLIDSPNESSDDFWARLNIKTVLSTYGISMLKIRRPLGRLIFNMGIAIPGKTVFLIETAPRWLSVMITKDIWAS